MAYILNKKEKRNAANSGLTLSMIFSGTDSLVEWEYGAPPIGTGLGAKDGLLVPPGKASNLLTDHLITDHYWLSVFILA